MERSPSPGRWPLSAPATAMLRAPDTPEHELLRLAVRELAVRGIICVELVERPAEDRLTPGVVDAAALPAPLAQLAARLLPHVAAEGTPARRAVRRAAGWRADLSAGVREATRHELATAGLLVCERDRLLGIVPRTRWRLTPSGRVWAHSASDAAAAAAGVLPAVGLLLALDEEVQRDLRGAVGADGGDGAATWGDVDALDAVLGDAGPALDSAVDAGSGAGGGDGGDGGGGGGD